MIEEFMLEKGWTVRENKPHRMMYSGYFKSGNQQWEGRILVTYKNDKVQVRPLILDPPIGIKKLPEGRCFRLVNKGWFDVHWETPPQTASDCVVYLEKIFAQAINLA